jgi:hypothetical protein
MQARAAGAAQIVVGEIGGPPPIMSGSVPDNTR